MDKSFDEDECFEIRRDGVSPIMRGDISVKTRVYRSRKVLKKLAVELILYQSVVLHSSLH